MKKTPCTPQVGADIEVFLYDEIKKKIVPCVGIIKGTKDKPFHPEDYPRGFALQEDNVMLEYNIPPAKSADTFYQRFPTARAMIEDNVPKNHSHLVVAEHKFLAKELRSPQAQMIGCEPDYSAYNGGEVRTPNVILGQHRSCGGHIHLGGNFNCPDFVSALFADLVLGVYTGTRSGEANTRTNWYGQPGIYRPKPYGIEYRTPDNQWTADRDMTYRVGTFGLVLTQWLTTNEAEVIRRTFKQINWPRVRDYMRPDGYDANVYTAIVNEARQAGVPIQ